jgi:hypothetical protein
VDEALEHRFAAAVVDRLAVEVVLDQIVFLDKLGSNGAGEVIPLRIARRAQADVPVGVDDAVCRKNAVRSDQVLEFFQRRFP